MKRYARSTLKRQTKDWLLDHIECLEHNIDALNEMNAQQYENVKDWQPVKHGHWLIKRGHWLKLEDFCKELPRTECSSCGKICENIHHSDYRYCPYCGCRMDEEVSE